ncbi:MAG TPA: aldo/keto reductase [Luteitalea sp.]|nr:aldo/keto reductase [Luteitalea sp.]
MTERTTLTRREALTLAGATGAGLALSHLGVPLTLAAQGAAITKTIPKSGEKLPVIGLGTNAYSVTAADAMPPLKDVLSAMPAAGGTLIDTAPGYGRSEIVLGELIASIGNRDKFFLATKVLAPDVAAAEAMIEESFKRLKTDRIELMQVHNITGIDTFLPMLQKLKAQKRIRYIGVTTSADKQYPELIAAMKAHPLDFIQVDYSLDNRDAAKEVLPLAQELKMGVLCNLPLGGRRGSLFRRVQGQPVPDWAKAFDATTWSHVFLKYVVSHPAVTAAIPGTTKVDNMKDNQGAGKGKLPTAAQRAQIEKFWDALPPAPA